MEVVSAIDSAETEVLGSSELVDPSENSLDQL